MMRFNLPETEAQPETTEPRIGYVYRARGGASTRYWCVVALSETGSTVHLLGLDAKGNPVSTSSYNRRSVEDRAVVGVVDLSGLEFDVRPVQ